MFKNIVLRNKLVTIDKQKRLEIIAMRARRFRVFF